jgi:hypothetical protein
MAFNESRPYPQRIPNFIPWIVVVPFTLVWPCVFHNQKAPRAGLALVALACALIALVHIRIASQASFDDPANFFHRAFLLEGGTAISAAQSLCKNLLTTNTQDFGGTTRCAAYPQGATGLDLAGCFALCCKTSDCALFAFLDGGSGKMADNTCWPLSAALGIGPASNPRHYVGFPPQPAVMWPKPVLTSPMLGSQPRELVTDNGCGWDTNSVSPEYPLQVYGGVREDRKADCEGTIAAPPGFQVRCLCSVQMLLHAAPRCTRRLLTIALALAECSPGPHYL